jgi:DNA-binding NtrC family response regulator
MEKKKVLIVDDEIDFLQLLKLRLEANNYNVITATNGKEALEKFKTEKPEAVMLDILMPGIDGLDVLKKIRKENQKTPIFIITSFSNEERFKVANQCNASGFIIKTSDLQSEIDNITKNLEIADRYKK